MKTKGDQLVEAWRAHGGSDAELGAAIDQLVEQEIDACAKVVRDIADKYRRDAEFLKRDGDEAAALSFYEFSNIAHEAVSAIRARKDVGTYAIEIRVTATVDYLIRNWSTMTTDEQIGYVRQIAERLSTAERAAARKATP